MTVTYTQLVVQSPVKYWRNKGELSLRFNLHIGGHIVQAKWCDLVETCFELAEKAACMGGTFEVCMEIHSLGVGRPREALSQKVSGRYKIEKGGPMRHWGTAERALGRN